MISVGSATLTALSAAKVRLALFVEIAFTSGTQRYVTAAPNISWDSQTWIGGGAIQSVDAVQESGALEASGWRIVFSGTPSERLSLAAGEIAVGRRVTAWIGAYGEDGVLVATPFKKFEGAVNDMTIEEGPRESRVILRVESRMIWLLRARPAYWTHAEQRKRYPTDNGFIFTDVTAARTLKYGPKV